MKQVGFKCTDEDRADFDYINSITRTTHEQVYRAGLMIFKDKADKLKVFEEKNAETN